MVRAGPLWDHAEAMAPRDRPQLRNVRRGDDRLIAGVCSGIAHTLQVDPIIVRPHWAGMGERELLDYLVQLGELVDALR